ncbi:MAG TPA: isopentenyl-diphosphate Delta-isomerase [Arachnia sp.]|mgnify:CR=1 FL=1|nr:isopentenyl-diphosphate Delta-isomerase [Arachnia sp.]HMR12272.1 isopentenyl-diphosphate Delta-isomerase [Arachnia sp.]
MTDPAPLDPAGLADAVVLLDADGRPCGAADRTRIHTGETPYHLAFSSYLFDDRGRVLLTRRALGKKTWPGVWTNSCCGHPRPGEEPRDAVVRRVIEELGHPPVGLRLVLDAFAYRAVDASGVVENELCPVWVGRFDPERLSPEPDEVMDTAWVAWRSLVDAIAAVPQAFSPWAALQVPLLDAALNG